VGQRREGWEVGPGDGISVVIARIRIAASTGSSAFADDDVAEVQ